MFQEPNTKAIVFEGGLNLRDSYLTLSSGEMISCSGIEGRGGIGGYFRPGGYERCTNDTVPSDFGAVSLKIENVAGDLVEGEAFTCALTGSSFTPLETYLTLEDNDEIVGSTKDSDFSPGDSFARDDNSSIYMSNTVLYGLDGRADGIGNTEVYCPTFSGMEKVTATMSSSYIGAYTAPFYFGVNLSIPDVSAKQYFLYTSFGTALGVESGHPLSLAGGNLSTYSTITIEDDKEYLVEYEYVTSTTSLKITVTEKKTLTVQTETQVSLFSIGPTVIFGTYGGTLEPFSGKLWDAWIKNSSAVIEHRWPFEDGTGSLSIDDVVGTATGTVTTTDIATFWGTTRTGHSYANQGGLDVFGTLTETAVASGAELEYYSGFSIDNFIEQEYTADLDFVTKDFAFVLWLKEDANTADEVIFERDSPTSAQRITAQVNADGTLSFTCDDDTTARTATSTGTIDDGSPHLVEFSYRSGTIGISIDGTTDGEDTAAALLTLSNANAVFRVGIDTDGANPLTNGSVCLIRAGHTDLFTAAELASIVTAEGAFFAVDASFYRREQYIGSPVSFDVVAYGSSITQTQRMTYNVEAIDGERGNIPGVTGSGDIEGIFRLRGIVYAFRGGKLYKGSSHAWTEVTMPSVMYFHKGVTAIKEDHYITDGTATAYVGSVTRQTGSYDSSLASSSQSAGYLTLTDVVGDFAADGDIYRYVESVPVLAAGDCATDTFTKGTGWAHDAGNSEYDATAGTASDLEKGYALASGRIVRITFRVKNYSAGTLTPKFGSDKGTAVSATGYYSQIITTTAATTTVAFEKDAAFIGSVTDIAIEDAEAVPTIATGDFAADQDWTKGTGYTIAAGVATGAAGTQSDLKQNCAVPADRAITVTFTVSAYASGNVRAKFGADTGAAVIADGTYSHVITTSNAVTTFAFQKSDDFVGSIDNVSFTDAVYADVKTANTAYSLNSGGRYEFRKYNFTNLVDNESIWGADGANDAFQFDGTHYIPIFHPDSTEYPKHILIFQSRTWLAFPGGEWAYSVSGEPRRFDPLLFAGTYSTGAEITGAEMVNGNAAVVFCEGAFWIITGTGVYDETAAVHDWTFYRHDGNVGATEWSIAGRSDFIFLDGGDLKTVKTTDSYGDFTTNPISTKVTKLLQAYKELVTAAIWCKSKQQYRIFFSNNSAIYIAFDKGKVVCPTVVTIPVGVNCAYSYYEDGEEYLYFGTTDGYVYRMDSGNSYDAAAITGSFRLPFYSYGNPRQDKHFLQMILDMVPPSLIADNTEFTFAINLNQGSQKSPRPIPTTIDDIVQVGGVYGVNDGYGKLTWDGPIQTQLFAYLDGYGENMSILITYSTKYDTEFSFLSALVDYIPLGYARN